MVLALALLEGGALFSAVCSMIFFWARPVLVDWSDAVPIVGQVVVLCSCCIIAFYYNDLYDLRLTYSFAAFAPRLLQAFGVAFVLLSMCYTLLPGTRIAQGPFVSSVLIVVVFLLPLRALSYALLRSRPFLERVLILGTSPLAMKLIAEIEARPNCQYVVVGVVDEPSRLREFPRSIPFCGPLAHLGTLIEELRPHRVVAAMAERRGQLPFRQLLEARVRGIPVEDGAAMYERLTGKLAIESLTPSYLIFSKDFKKAHLELATSRILSVVFAATALVVLAPLLGLIVLAIKLDSKGPIFIVQDRVGTSGRPFKLVKLRTMHPATGERSVWFQDNYTRITRVGRWLRKFRLDELPQCLSILRGDMNLVGPRPHRLEKFRALASQIPYFSLRTVVPPGLTGWAQVRHGYASDLEEEVEKVRYDLYYIKHLSVWLDLRILCDTAKITFFGRGSAVAPRGRTSVDESRRSDAHAALPLARITPE